LLASLTSAAALALASVSFMWLAAQADAANPPGLSYLKVGMVAFVATLMAQLLVGSAVWLTLAPRGLFRPMTVALVYLVPTLLLGFVLADRSLDIQGIAPWAIGSVIAALAFWAVAPSA